MKKNGAFYVISLWALTWDDENYYLVAYDASAGIIKHYRVDKMRDTEILESDRKGEESFKKLVSVSSQFFGWLTGVGSGMRIVGPGFFGGTKPCYKKNCILRGGFYKC